MPAVEVFAEIVCPFTHVGLQRFVAERTSRRAGVAIRVRAWPLEWVNGHPQDPDMLSKEIAALRATVAPDLFTGFDAALVPRTSIPAFGLAGAAYDRGDASGEAVSLELRRAVFERGEDVSEDEVLDRIGAPFGIGATDAHAATDGVRADWEEGKARGVTGSPHFFTDGTGWFCPALSIRHEGDEYLVHVDEPARDAFYRAAFGT